jgi:hypothetical protein
MPDGSFYITEPNKVVSAGKEPVHVPSYDELVALIWRARLVGAENQTQEREFVRRELGDVVYYAIPKRELRNALHEVSDQEKRKGGRPRKPGLPSK